MHCELDNTPTNDICNALENSPIKNNENLLIGFVRNVVHRNATLYYGDLFLTDKTYSHECSIKNQIPKFDDNSKLNHIVSYISDIHE